MIQHGIHTSKAMYWVHVHPVTCEVFWYKVADMLRWIEDNKPPVKDGHSKDAAKTVTSRGYCVPKHCPGLIKGTTASDSYFKRSMPWEDMTDREAGRNGQEIGRVLIEKGLVKLDRLTVERVTTNGGQFDGIDYIVTYADRIPVEIKTDRKTTQNIFVQVEELNHKPIEAPGGGQRYTPQPGIDW